MHQLLTIIICGLSLLFPLTVFSATCSETIQLIIENPEFTNSNPETLKALPTITSAIGTGDKKTITEQSYTWKSQKNAANTYTIQVRDGVTINAEDKGIKPDFGNRKFPTLIQATKQLGKPEVGPVKELSKTVWTCQDTKSFVAIYSDATGKIINYKGQFCPSTIFKDDCATFGD